MTGWCTAIAPRCGICWPRDIAPRHAIRPAAQDDLSGIWRHGAQTWGVDQADRYADTLFALFDLLAGFPEMAPAGAEVTPPVRIHPVGTHLVICRTVGAGVDILRIRHAHQNLTACLPEV